MKSSDQISSVAVAKVSQIQIRDLQNVALQLIARKWSAGSRFSSNFRLGRYSAALFEEGEQLLVDLLLEG